MNIIYLHQSTGGIIWQGTKISLLQRAAGKISTGLKYAIARKPQLPLLFKKYNEENNTNYLISEMFFPEKSSNNPYNYYNIWVKNSGNEPYSDEPALEILTRQYQVIIFKHCYTSSHIEMDQDSAHNNPNLKTISNYKLHYNALRDKLHTFPDTKFILFTSAVEVKSGITEDEAARTKEFFNWVIEEWDQPDDNIYLWDLYSLQTEGGLYFRDKYAISPSDSHPNEEFASKSVKLLFGRIIDILNNDGSGTQLTGENK